MAETRPARLKREDHNFTRHDSVFSRWKTLVDCSDWKDYESGKDGCTRYRIDNLPTGSSSQGLYELGLVSSEHLGRRIRSKDVIPVYVGEADNVRVRLQEYGRDGSHLGSRSIRSKHENDVACFSKGPGLFNEAFSKGYSIVYRWVQVDNKKKAGEIEAQLLRVYDYAWNKSGNGPRRSAEIVVKLDKIIFAQSHAANIFDNLFHWKPYIFGRKKVGIEIDGHRPIEDAIEKIGHSTDIWKRKLPFSLLRRDKSKPHLAPRNFFTDAASNWKVAYKETENYLHVCGVRLEDGSMCLSSPIFGRKRCMLHKGIKVNRKTKFVGNLILAKGGSYIDKSYLSDRELDPSLKVTNEVDINGTSSLEEMKKIISTEDEDETRVCGKVMSDVRGTSTGSDIQIDNKDASTMEIRGVLPTNDSKSKDETVVNPKVDHPICGVNLCSGSVCQKKPVKGRKRCSEHKGMRIGRIVAVTVVS